MLNRYEQQKQLRDAVHKDMEERVSREARADFERRPYAVQGGSVMSIIEIKKDISYLLSRAGRLDDWERETIRRIAKRIEEGSGRDGQDHSN